MVVGKFFFPYRNICVIFETMKLMDGASYAAHELVRRRERRVPAPGVASGVFEFWH